ncbi:MULTISPECIES: DNA cytosine methyltransferase [unclassified Sphingomonas]|uniref:DNA cytosine methyltransferase n=1 Tax=unclassified Sphingomonas TaxID=196159 RepID=UPI00226A8488|nr:MULTISPECIES: DNA cytosine methyltransferase [unclassified Sphingomonas]
MLQRTTTERVFRVAHMFCGVGAGAKGFNDANPRIGHVAARFECAGGIDVDAGAIRNFERITGTRGTVMDLFDVEQYTAFFGRAPHAGWREAVPADISATFGPKLDVMFLSAPCKGFSGLLSAAASGTAKYQALNRLTLRGIWLTLEAYKNDPIAVILFENVPRIATRGRALLEQIKSLLRAYGYVFAETTHDCGEIGGLAQSRKRFLLVARHSEKVPPFLYQPKRSRLRGVGEVIGQLPLPGAEAAGPMHRVPMLQWKTWVRLAFVEAGQDWRSLNRLRVEDGVLADFGIVPDRGLRDNQLGVLGWGETAPTLTGQRSPAQGRFSVADPRPADAAWQADVLGVRRWDRPSGVVPGRSGCTNGAYSVADPREDGRHHGSLGVRAWDQPTGVVAGATRPSNGPHSVADPRPQQANQSFAQYGVRAWQEHAGTVTAQAAPGGGPNSVADPRLGRVAHSNVYRIARFDEPAVAVTSSRDTAVADPRGGPDASKLHGCWRVEGWDHATKAVIGGNKNGASAVADPRPVCLNAESRTGYSTQGHYGVLDWSEPSRTVPGYAKYDRGHWSIADPREMPAAPIAALPAPADRLIARIVALDGTWHRPFTTLELAALQSLFDPGEVFDLEGGSDQVKREWIGNAVPSAAARGMAETIGETLLLASMGESFMLSSREIWTKPLAVALAVDPRQPIDGMDA